MIFPVGAPVYVYASSLRGRLGPKQHSLGFLSAYRNSPSFWPHSYSPAGFSSLNMKTFECEIVFTRYGKELGSRREVRTVNMLIPAVPKDLPAVSDTVSKIMQLFHDGELVKKKYSELLRDTSALCCLIPAEPKELNENDVISYTLAALNNTNLMYKLRANRSLPTLLACVKGSTISRIIGAWMGKEKRQMLFYKLRDPVYRKYFLEELRRLIAVLETRQSRYLESQLRKNAHYTPMPPLVMDLATKWHFRNAAVSPDFAYAKTQQALKWNISQQLMNRLIKLHETSVALSNLKPEHP